MMSVLDVDGCKIKISNPNKILWTKLEITKIDYIDILIKLSPFLLPYTTNRLLTTIRYPDNIENKSFFQKKLPESSPEWIDTIDRKEDSYINLNKLQTLIWLGNLASLEFHTSFNRVEDNFVSYLVFDLDPSDGQDFDFVIEVALIIYKELNKLNINSYIKTSGATGLQIFIPIEPKYSYEEARKINEFFGMYFSKKYPHLITIERSVKKRGHLLYFDYLQMWKGKSIISVYSPRAVKSGAVSTPITWDELKKGVKPEDFNLKNIISRLNKKGDLFDVFLLNKERQNLDYIFKIIKR